jgi:hypothetical protein
MGERMDNGSKDLIIIFVLACIFLSGLVGLGYVLEKERCHAKWKMSEMQSEYGFFSGCLVKTKTGQWIPSKNYREFD